jgi:hypothetical protein
MRRRISDSRTLGIFVGYPGCPAGGMRPWPTKQLSKNPRRSGKPIDSPAPNDEPSELRRWSG